MYKKVLEFTVKEYKQLAQYYYKKANSGKSLRDDWIDEYLMEYNPVTKYIFKPELERRKGRLLETVLYSNTRNKDLDESLKSWSKMLKQAAEDITFDVTIQGYKDAGIRKVIWQTEIDGRECSKCRDLDGKVFDIDKVPNKPHINCRCWLKPY